MANVLERALAILEALGHRAEGMSIGAIASELSIPPSAAHRMLRELTRCGYVRQDGPNGDYSLTMKLASTGLSFLGQVGVTDVAQTILDGLAARCGELVRLSLADDGQLIWISFSQGAPNGLRYHPGGEQGVAAHLASTAVGQAWLSTMNDTEALALVDAQGLIPTSGGVGPSIPRTTKELLQRLRETRQRGYSRTLDSHTSGMAALAAPVSCAGRDPAVGTISIAGPTVRFTPDRVDGWVSPLLTAAVELGRAASASRFFSKVKGPASESRRGAT
jgi:IclR family transcriptional regulator, acetate operon repressor